MALLYSKMFVVALKGLLLHDQFKLPIYIEEKKLDRVNTKNSQTFYL